MSSSVNPFNVVGHHSSTSAHLFDDILHATHAVTQSMHYVLGSPIRSDSFHGFDDVEYSQTESVYNFPSHKPLPSALFTYPPAVSSSPLPSPLTSRHYSSPPLNNYPFTPPSGMLGDQWPSWPSIPSSVSSYSLTTDVDLLSTGDLKDFDTLRCYVEKEDSEEKSDYGSSTGDIYLNDEEEQDLLLDGRHFAHRVSSKARQLDLEDNPQSLLLLPQCASSAEQSTSSVVNSSSSPLPEMTDGLISTCTMRKPLSVLESDPSAGGGSVVAGDQTQAQRSPPVLWCTLPQLRNLLAESTDVDRSEWERVQEPSILLGFHQDYPVVSGMSQVSYLVSWRCPGIQVIQQPPLTLEPPFQALKGVRIPNTFYTSFPQQVTSASNLLEPKACELHLVDMLFDMARINSALATILDRIPIMSYSQLQSYHREDIDLIVGRQPHYGRFGERKIGTGILVQVHVALLRAKEGFNCPVPPPEPVVFFTAAGSHPLPYDTKPIAHPILLQSPFTHNLLYSTSRRERYPYEATSRAASLASVTFHYLTAVSKTDAHWYTATHNVSPAKSDVMTVFVAPTESSSSTTPAPVPLVYRYLTADLNNLPSSSTHNTLREQNIIRIWRTVTSYFHERSTPRTHAQSTTEESTRMRRFVDCFLDSVSSGWTPNRFIKWCLGAAKGKNRVHAMCHLCDVMQLKSIRAYVDELRSTHIQCMVLIPSDSQNNLSSEQDLQQMNKQRKLLTDKETEIMQKMCHAISSAFRRSMPNSAGPECLVLPMEDIITPMELLSLVIWQSEVTKLEVAQQCLQALQEELGIGDDRAILLEWLAKVRTFSLDAETGQLLVDPNIQWVTTNVYTVPSSLSLSAAAGQQKYANPPALLISYTPTSDDNDPRDHSGRTEYHLLQVVDQPEDSPLHSRYTSSLSNLILSPLLPFIPENAWVNDACRLYFLPALQIHHSINIPQASPVVSSMSATSFSTASATSSSSHPGLHLSLRCGQTVQISPQLCTQLGSCGQRPESGTGEVMLKTEKSSQLMVFFGALLMVGSQASGAAEIGNAEVWALLNDMLGRWWVYRVDLSSPSAQMLPCMTGKGRQSLEGRETFRHLLGPSIDGEHERVSDDAIPPVKWGARCQQLWTAVLSWLHFTGDRVVPPPAVAVVQSVKAHGPMLPQTVITIPPLPQQERLLEMTAAAEFSTATATVTELSGLEIQVQRAEVSDVEDEDFKTPRRSSRSHAAASDDVVQEAVKEPSKGRKKQRVEEKQGQGEMATKKSEVKADKQARLAARKEAERQEEEQRMEESRKQKLEAQALRMKEEKRRKRNENDRKRRAEKKGKGQLHTAPTEVKMQPADAMEGMRTRRGAAKIAPSINEQPITLPATSSSSKGSRGKRKGSGSREKSEPQVTMECEDVKGKESGDVERNSTRTSNKGALLASAGVSVHVTNSGTSSSESVTLVPSPAVVVDVLDSESQSGEVLSDIITPVPGPRHTLWHLFISGYKNLVTSHKKQMNEWFQQGFYNGPNFSRRNDQDMRGPNVDIYAEWDFLRQTSVTAKVHPNYATALDRTKIPRVDLIAQCFVASAGLHDTEVQDGYFEAVKTHQMLTDSFAIHSKGKPAHHTSIPHPWVSYKGITLTTIDGDRLNVDGHLIDNTTPSYPPGTFPDLDMFRAKLEAKATEEGELPPPVRKKVKTESRAASALDDDSRSMGPGPGREVPSHISDTFELEQSTSMCLPESDARDQELNRLRAENQRLRTQMHTSGVSGSLSLGPSALSASNAGSSSPLHSSHPFSSTNSSSRAPASDAPIQSAGSRQSADNTALIHIPATSSVNGLIPPIRNPSGSAVATTPPYYPPAVYSQASLSGHGPVGNEMVSTDFMRMMLESQTQAAAATALKEQSAMAKVHDFNRDQLINQMELRKDKMLFSINEERMTKGWKAISQLPKDLTGDRLGEKEFSELSLSRYPFARVNGPVGRLTAADVAGQPNYSGVSAALPLLTSSSYCSFRSSSPPTTPLHYNQVPYGQVPLPHPPHFNSNFSRFSYPLQASQCLQAQQHYAVRM